MLLIRCPYCEMDRPELEFRHGGEAHVARAADPMAADDAAWAEHLYYRTNTRGVHAERWRHVHGCGRFFNCIRDTVSDRIVQTYKAGIARPEGSAQNAGVARPEGSAQNSSPSRPEGSAQDSSPSRPGPSAEAAR